jgi:hypothetical protein
MLTEYIRRIRNMYKNILLTTTVATLLCVGMTEVRATEKLPASKVDLKPCYDECRAKYSALLHSAWDRLRQIHENVHEDAIWHILEFGDVSTDGVISEDQIAEALKMLDPKDMANQFRFETEVDEPSDPKYLEKVHNEAKAWQGKPVTEFWAAVEASRQNKPARDKAAQEAIANISVLKASQRDCAYQCYKKQKTK